MADLADPLEEALAGLAFELKVRRECYRREHGKLVRFVDRDRELPHEPSWFKPTYGSYNEIRKQAVKANEQQIAGGFLDYLFFPEVVTS